MNGRHRLVLGAALVLATVAGLAHGREDGRAIIYPEQRLAIRMTHRFHVQRLGLRCTECHTAATGSPRTEDRLLPTPDRCDRCHHTDHSDLGAVQGEAGELGTCAVCHVGHEPEHGNRVVRTVLPAAHLKMDHAAHAARNIGCAQCHRGVEHVDQATRAQLPSMRECARCHLAPGPARGEANGSCRTCHLTQGGVLRTKLPTGQLLPPSWLGNAGHGPRWLERHAGVAAARPDLCASCHRQQECVDCHDGRVRPRAIHPNDWLSQHGLVARQDGASCTSCHRAQSTCLACHQRVGVTWTSSLAAATGRGRFHPPEFGRPRGHAREARRNLGACVSCHVERECATCHATAARGGAGVGANPHGHGFAARCGSAYRKNPRPCLVCHERGDPLLERCR